MFEKYGFYISKDGLLKCKFGGIAQLISNILPSDYFNLITILEERQYVFQCCLAYTTKAMQTFSTLLSLTFIFPATHIPVTLS